MKIGRLIRYGIAGIIAGLLLENELLARRQRLYQKAKQRRKAAQASSEEEPIVEVRNLKARFRHENP
jgi:hypothetical protein